MKIVMRIFQKYKELLLFLFFNAGTTVFNFLLYYVLYAVVLWNYMAASIFSYTVSVFLAFYLNRRCVFLSQANVKTSLSFFILLKVVLGIIGNGLLYAGVEWLEWKRETAWGASTGLCVIISYLLSRLIFKGTERRGRKS